MPDYRMQFSLSSPLELNFSDRDGDHIGILKLKPSTLQWISAGDKKYRSVPLDRFVKWIEKEGTLVKF